MFDKYVRVLGSSRTTQLIPLLRAITLFLFLARFSDISQVKAPLTGLAVSKISIPLFDNSPIFNEVKANPDVSRYLHTECHRLFSDYNKLSQDQVFP